MNTIVKSCLDWSIHMTRVLLNIVLSVRSMLGPGPGWTGLKRWLIQIAVLGALVGIGGFLVVSLGLVPIKASSGHWKITAWFLNFTMNRSVSTHARGIKAPNLDDPGMILKGATHYKTGCFPCHGSPAIQHPRIARQMTPHPPYLPQTIHQWEPEELFYIVKHGIKFTGMPAWPTQKRDDEVWAIVAFLREFPELNEKDYQRMVDGENDASDPRSTNATEDQDAPLEALSGRAGVVKSISDSCERCHGVGGQGRNAGVAPKLLGQRPAYLEASLKAFASGERFSGIMEPIAVGMSSEEMREVAYVYGRLDVSPGTRGPAGSEHAISRGAKIALEGVPGVPICAQCHGPGEKKRNSAYPDLAGQYAIYLKQQLEIFADNRRGGSPFASLMHPIAKRLTREQMSDVALYYESLSTSMHASRVSSHR